MQGPKTNKSPAKPRKPNRYQQLIDKIFFERYTSGATEIPFRREDFQGAAEALGVKLPKNLGDVLYSFRFRAALSEPMLATQSPGLTWRIELAGTAMYKFVLGTESKISPNPAIPTLHIPDSTPAIIAKYALRDEQALLAIVRYNRLIDIFLGVTAYSLQNHLRTNIKGIGQIEIDELYVGIDQDGQHFVAPVQAKGGRDQISVVQTSQDIRACGEKFPGIPCRPVSVQFLPNKTIAMFELSLAGDVLEVRQERHYQLVSHKF